MSNVARQRVINIMPSQKVLSLLSPVLEQVDDRVQAAVRAHENYTNSVSFASNVGVSSGTVTASSGRDAAQI